MGSAIVMLAVFAVVLVYFFAATSNGQKSGKSSVKRLMKDVSAELEHGKINPHMNCPHCATTGKIRTKSISQKKGVSGGKATAAVLTGGVSLLATGLSRKEGATQARCDKCKNTWQF